MMCRYIYNFNAFICQYTAISSFDGHAHLLTLPWVSCYFKIMYLITLLKYSAIID